METVALLVPILQCEPKKQLPFKIAEVSWDRKLHARALWEAFPHSQPHPP